MDVVNVLSSTYITPKLLDAYRTGGVKMVVSRTVGVEHIDVAYANAVGIAVGNAPYSPASVADYAIMMMLMVLRHIKAHAAALCRAGLHGGYLGRELPNLNVGHVGLGRIGETVARHLQGFGCRILGWNRTPRADLSDLVEAVELDELLSRSDIVSLHLTACPETEHFIDVAAIEKMKDGAVLINTARGPLVNNSALIDALESGKLSGAGLDVFDGDRLIYYRDFKNQLIAQRQMAILNAMPNVLMLPHMAYYTDQAVEDMVRNSLDGAARYLNGEEDPWLIGEKV